MSVEQAIRELQEQLQREFCRQPSDASRIDCTPQYGRYEVARPVGGSKDPDARPVRKEQRPQLENLVVSGERLRRRGARCAEAGDEGRRELAALLLVAGRSFDDSRQISCHHRKPLGRPLAHHPSLGIFGTTSPSAHLSPTDLEK